MQTYRVTFFVPFTFAEFSCEASSIEDARQQRLKRDRREGFDIANREIRAEYWGGKKV
jgi:2-oxo-4-hydroxy-4-carboxy--5-ureidoimidazoline (OHCU) decarboxylase